MYSKKCWIFHDFHTNKKIIVHWLGAKGGFTACFPSLPFKSTQCVIFPRAVIIETASSYYHSSWPFEECHWHFPILNPFKNTHLCARPAGSQYSKNLQKKVQTGRGSSISKLLWDCSIWNNFKKNIEVRLWGNLATTHTILHYFSNFRSFYAGIGGRKEIPYVVKIAKCEEFFQHFSWNNISQIVLYYTVTIFLLQSNRLKWHCSRKFKMIL